MDISEFAPVLAAVILLYCCVPATPITLLFISFVPKKCTNIKLVFDICVNCQAPPVYSLYAGLPFAPVYPADPL